tara:strand:- start:1172 stop:4072 length:2901 start_codon:yes stop_codon:yes gene_type:complete
MGDIINGFPEVALSITNPNVSREDALDVNEPFTFIQFIENVDASLLTPSTIQNFYVNYLTTWNNINTVKAYDDNELIINRYKDFLRDITLNYSTNAEKKFISQIDLNDKNDLRIVASFYSKKIREIISYYTKKRTDLSFSSTKAQLKGTQFNLEQSALDLILNFLENRSTGNIDYDIDTIKNDLSISVTEYFDNFTQYFNQDPDAEYYGKNFLEFDPTGPVEDDIFLTDDNNLILQAFGLIDFDDLTDPVILNEVDQLFDNKRKQTKKYIGTDYYYLSTNAFGDSVVDILFKADAPYANYLNQQYPTTASIFSEDIISERNLGFFRPTNSSIISIQSKRLQFFKKERYGPDELYIFPNPHIYTNDRNIFTFVVDTSRAISNISKGLAVNQPNTDKASTSFLGYNSEIPQDRNINTDLSFLFDEGYIDDSKRDLFGNTFGLIKDNNYYRNNVINETPTTIKNLIFNGYQFFDSLYGEGYNFNYSTTDSTTYSQTIRSGLSTFTNGMTGKGEGLINPNTPASWTTFPTSAYNIFFRYFNPYQELLTPNDFAQVDYTLERPINADVKEGAYFTFSDSEDLASTLSTDLSAFTSSFEGGGGSYYFTQLIEGGVAQYDGAPQAISKSTIIHALSDTTFPTISGDFTLNARLSGGKGNAGNGVQDLEGGLFTDNLIFNFSPDNEQYGYSNEVFNSTEILTIPETQSSYFNKEKHLGKIYVKNTSVTTALSPVRELTKSLPYISTKYNTTICDELSTSVNNFDIVYDTLFIETSSYFIIEKTEYKNNGFVNPNTMGISLSHSSNFFNKLSNRFKVGNDIFYCRLVKEQIYDLSSFRAYPEIWKYDYNKGVNTQIYPTTNNPVVSSAAFFTCSGNNVMYLEFSKPFLTYSSDNEQFNLGVLIKDQNQSPVVLNYLFEYDTEIKFLNSDFYLGTNNNFTYLFLDNADVLDTQYLAFSLSGNEPVSAAALTQSLVL